MRSFSDVNLLIVLLLALGVCALPNLQITYEIAEWVCEVSLWLLSHALDFVRHGV
jgi:hypothetical protein